MKKNHVTLFMAATADYAFALGNVLIGLNTCSPNFADRVVIYHDGLHEHDMACLQKIRPCEFQKYNPPAFAGLALSAHAKRFSLMAFARYEMFNLLETSEYVIYLDADVAILRDVSGLLEYTPIGMKTGGFALNVSLGPNEFDIPDTIPGHNSGVIIAHESLPWQGLKETCYELTLRLWDTLHFPDQGVINLALYLKGIAVTPFPKTYNAHMNEFAPQTCILHQPTSAKFWNHGIVNLLSPEWEEYNRCWQKLGGTPYKKGKNKWEFASMRGNMLNNMVLMSNVYKDVLERFLFDLRERLAGVGVATEIRNYTLTVQSHAHEGITLDIGVWGGVATAKLHFLRNEDFLHLCNLVENDATITCRTTQGKSCIEKKTVIDVSFLQSGSGLAWSVDTLRHLALLTKKLPSRPLSRKKELHSAQNGQRTD